MSTMMTDTGDSRCSQCVGHNHPGRQIMADMHLSQTQVHVCPTAVPYSAHLVPR